MMALSMGPQASNAQGGGAAFGLARWLLACLFLLLAAAACAEETAEVMPDQRPYLRIEAGMHTAVINRIGVSADGKLMVTGSDDKTICLWSLPEGKLIRVFRVPIGEGNDGKVYAVAISPDGRTVAAGGWDHHWRDQSKPIEMYITLFDTVSGTQTVRLGPLPNVILDLAFSPDGRWLAAGLGGQNGIRLWDGPGSTNGFAGAPRADKAYSGAVYGLTFDSAGRLAVTSYDGDVRRYDLAALTGAASLLTPQTRAKAPGGARPFGIAFSPDGRRLAVGYTDSTKVSLLDAESLVPVPGGGPDTALATNGDLGRVAWSADGRSLYAGGRYDDGDDVSPVIAWGEAGLGPPRPLAGPRNTVMDLESLPGGGLAWGGGDPAFGLFDGAGTATLRRDPPQADMRRKRSGHFWASPDGAAVWFGLKLGSEDPWLFDATALSFAAPPARPEGFIEPVTEGLPIENWINDTQPTLDAQLLPLDTYEISRSLAIAPDDRSFWLGTDWSIYHFSDRGEQIRRLAVPGVAWGVNLADEGRILIAAFGDGTIRWYNAETGKELLAVFVHTPDKRWVAWTPTGYYAASPGAEDLIGWHLNGRTWDETAEFFAASRFRDRFYRPDIVKLVLKTRDEATAIADANRIAQRETETAFERATLPPVVEIIADPRGIEAATEEIEIAYRLRAPSGREVTRIELRVDGQLQESVARGFVAVEDTDDGTRIRVRLPPRDARVSLVAFHGEQASAAAEVLVTWKGAVKELPERNLYAVLVGISAYEDTSLTLKYADDDARALAETLRAQEGRFFKRVEIRTLIDSEATKDAITEAIAELADKGTAEDYKLVFLAGHGATRGKNFYFLPHGANPSGAKLVSTGLSGSVIRENLIAMPGKVLFFIDACYSATTLGTDIVGYLLSITGEENAVMMYASSSRGEVSLENSRWGHGAFTKALIDIFADEKSYNARGEIMTDDLASKLREAVWTLTEQRQTTIGQASGAIEAFPLAGR